jgi:hypothetical protein
LASYLIRYLLALPNHIPRLFREADQISSRRDIFGGKGLTFFIKYG